MKEIDVFHFDNDRKGFDDFGHSNGIDFWYARDLMEFLGYTEFKRFNKVIQKAITACSTLEIDILGNFEQVKRTMGGEDLIDYKLSKFACFLVAMNGDPKIEQVAAAQIYFVKTAEMRLDYFQEAENVERVIIRNEITDSEKSLNGVVHTHGVVNWPLFQNAGYRGMYNMNITDLKRRKGLIEGRSLLDFMGKQELAANLFRITQTEAKILNEDVRGQSNLERAAETVGRVVRQTMIEISNTTPEELQLAEDIKTVKSRLKSTHRHFKQLRIVWKEEAELLFSKMNPYSRKRLRLPKGSG